MNGRHLLLLSGMLLFSIQVIFAQAGEISYHPLGKWHTITSKFGYRSNPFFNDRDSQFHKGVDIDTEVGDSVYAWRSGTILFTGYSKLSGNMVNIQHKNAFISKYHHLYKIFVKKGASVKAGQLVALAGKSGRVTGSHLHFSILHYGKHVDPLPFLKKSRNIPRTGIHPPTQKRPVYKQVAIRSFPVDGDIILDGKAIGRTPTEVQLSYGEHFVEIDSGNSYERFIGRLWVDQNFDQLYVAELQNKK